MVAAAAPMLDVARDLASPNVDREQVERTASWMPGLASQ